MLSKGLFPNKDVRRLLKLYNNVYALDYASSLLAWDSETYMPVRAASERGLVQGSLDTMRKKLITSKEFKNQLLKVKTLAANGLKLTPQEKGVVRLLLRELRFYEALPERFLQEFNKTTSKAKINWRIAREKSDFKIFKPWLERIVRLSIKKAELLGYERNPYDALLDLYEEGLTTNDMEQVFKALRSVKLLLKKIVSKKGYAPNHELESKRYDVKALRVFNNELIKLLGFDFKTERIDESAHPFTEGIGLFDVRITTRYEGIDFKRAISSTIHEFGHALYDLQLDKRFLGTPLADGASLGFHESQSRLWENIIGRSFEFLKLLKPLMDKRLGFTKQYKIESLYQYFNIVKPSLIRVDADEVSYNLHIMLRFEIEKELINNNLKVSELPRVWNEKMQLYLGLKPKNHALGVLQDIHWSLGSIGYFPTYSLGNVLSVQIANKLSKELKPLSDLIANKDFKTIRQWLKNNIHCYGAMLEPKQLTRKLFKSLKPEEFLDYLKRKYFS